MSQNQEQPDRESPNSQESERCVLGAVLRDNPLLYDLMPLLRTEDFYLFAHRIGWDAFLWLNKNNHPISLVTVADWLNDRKLVEDFGGYGYLAQLWDEAPTPGIALHYAQKIRSNAVRRDLINAAGKIAEGCYDKGIDTDHLIEDAERRLFNISQRCYSAGEVVTMEKVVMETLEVIDRRSGKHSSGKIEHGIMTGWKDLDQSTGGLRSQELVIVAARPSVGKTLFAMQLAGHAASEGKRVFFASLEQGRTELVLRMICRRAQIDSYHMRKGHFSTEDVGRTLDAADALKPYLIYFDDTGRQSSSRIISNARRLHMQHGLDLVVVDYLQIMESEERNAKRYEQVGLNALRMRQLGKELNIPVILLSQLSRALELRTNRTPQLSDLKESGDIEQHADTVLMLHKPEPDDSTRQSDLLEIHIKKQRNGPLGEVTLLHRKRYFDICNYQPDYKV
jgi:replicative DNA helicase